MSRMRLMGIGAAALLVAGCSFEPSALGPGDGTSVDASTANVGDGGAFADARPMADAVSISPDADRSCGSEATPIALNSSVVGSTVGGPRNLDAPWWCASSQGPEQVFRLDLPDARDYEIDISTDHPETNFDDVLYIRRVCGAGTNQCRRGWDPGATLCVDVRGPESIYIVVDTEDPFLDVGTGGDFKLSVTEGDCLF